MEIEKLLEFFFNEVSNKKQGRKNYTDEQNGIMVTLVTALCYCLVFGIYILSQNEEVDAL